MPVHDWTTVDAGIFHDFQLSWIVELVRAINTGQHLSDHYGLIEPTTGNIAKGHKKSYIELAKVIKVRHSSDHKVVAVIEIVSPGYKAGQRAFSAFIQKAVNLIHQGIHLLVVDLFPPSSRDPEGIHQAIWSELVESDFVLSEGKTGVLASYRASVVPEAFIEAISPGDSLAEMPVFLNEDRYVPLPLEKTYMKAWETVPESWREVIAQK